MTTNGDKDLKIASLNTELNLIRGAVDSNIHREPDTELQQEWLRTFETSLPLTLSNMITHYRGPSGTKSKKRKIQELQGGLADAELFCKQRTSEVIRHKEELKNILNLIRKTAQHPIVRKFKPSLAKEADRMDASSSLLSGPLRELLALLLKTANATTEHSTALETRAKVDSYPEREVPHGEAAKAPLFVLQHDSLAEHVAASAEQGCGLQQQPSNVESTGQEVRSTLFTNSVEPHAERTGALVENSSSVHKLLEVVAPTKVYKSADEEAVVSCTDPEEAGIAVSIP